MRPTLINVTRANPARWQEVDSDSSGSLKGWLALAREHLGLALSLLVGLAVTVKLFVVAHGDAVTVSTIVASQGLTGLLGSALVVGLPLFCIVFLWACLISLMEAVREGDSVRGPAIGFSIAVILGIAVVPVAAFAALLGLGIVYLLMSLAVRAWRTHRVRAGRPLNWWLKNIPRNDSLRGFIALAALLGAAAVVFSDTPWMPREAIRTVGGAREVGYVLGEGDVSVTLLRQTDRRVLRLPTGSVAEREICRAVGPTDLARRSLLATLVWGRDNSYPSCD